MRIRLKAEVAALAAMLLITSGAVASETSQVVQTQHLTVSGAPSVVSSARLQELAGQAEQTLEQILQTWQISAKVERFGKIKLEFRRPLNDTTRTSIFFWSQDEGRRVRIVRVFGAQGQPYGLAHKLTHAVFPSRDKLIRNMMGIYSENRFGSRKSFPMCGHNNDLWVQALISLGSYIPLTSLGPDHGDWGMEFRGQKPFVSDRARQHAAYVESGSFGEYLIKTHGINRMKRLCRLARDGGRAWQEVYGLSLKKLEAAWLEQLKASRQANSKEVAALMDLIKDNPRTACQRARGLVVGGTKH
ncbi:MAG: hypothetical protein KQI62_05650 [Deltaproteobacteria bacterium]|nr:hypothetical protein [Deltaproteobacteria bacterium]